MTQIISVAFRKRLDRIKGSLVCCIIPGSRNHNQGAGFLLLLVLILLVAWYKWTIFSGNTAPPGSDGGQWLAFGHELFGGENVRTGFQFYPPLLPFAVKLVSLVMGPLMALKLVGTLTSVLLAVPVYLLLHKTLSPWLSAALAVTVTLAPFNNEILSFGGYPQLLGTSFLLFSTFSLLMGFNTGHKRWFLLASLATAATMGSNVLTAFVLATTSGLITLQYFHKLWRGRESKGVLFHRLRSTLLWWLLPSVILSLPFSNIYFAYLSTVISSTASPNQVTIMEIAGWANSPWLFESVLWVGIASIIGFFFLLMGRAFFYNHALLASTSVALLLASSFGFFLMRELRFMGFLEISLILMTGLIPGRLDSILTHLKARQLLGRLILIFVLGLVLTVGTVGHRRLLIASDWYQVVNTPVLTAFDWLHDNADSGSIVITTSTSRWHNYGWWIEGYAHLPTYTAGNPSLFFFTEERTQVELARSILILDTPPSEIRVLAKQHGIRFLFLDKKFLQKTLIEWAPDNYLTRLYKAGFVKRFENDVILIMENKELR